MVTHEEYPLAIPGNRFDFEKMPGHWVLAQLGKKVLRPGGLELTRQMLSALEIQPNDSVVEFAPGLGVTAQMALSRNPASYTAVERDGDAANLVRRYLKGPNQTCFIGEVSETNLPTGSASILYSEAVLTMESEKHKNKIIKEARRILRENGRYGIHELCLVPEDISEDKKREIQKALVKAIRVDVRPLTSSEWRQRLELAGFQIEAQSTAPMHLLAVSRFIQDEGVSGILRFFWNLLRNPVAISRVKQMRATFQKYQNHLAAIMIVARKLDV